MPGKKKDDSSSSSEDSSSSSASSSSSSSSSHSAEKKPAAKVEKKVEKKAEKPAEKPAEKKAEKPAEKKAEKPAEKPAEKKAEKPAEKKAEKPVEKKAEKPAEKKTEKPAEKKAEKPAEKKTEKPAEKKTEKPAEKKAEKPAEKKVEKKAEKPAEKKEPAEKPAAKKGGKAEASGSKSSSSSSSDSDSDSNSDEAKKPAAAAKAADGKGKGKAAPAAAGKKPKAAAAFDPEHQAFVHEKGGKACGPIMRNLASKDGLLTKIPGREKVESLWGSFAKTAEQFPKNNAFGVIVNGKKITWTTYGVAKAEAEDLARGLQTLGVEKGHNIGFWARNCREWLIAEQACNAIGAPVVALYDTFGEDFVKYIVEHAKLDIVVCSAANTTKLLAIAEKLGKGTLPITKIVSIFPEDTKGWTGPLAARPADGPKHGKKDKKTGITVYHYEQLVAEGKAAEEKKEFKGPSGEDLALIMYTSGTTGPPKGVMHSNNGIIAAVASAHVVLNPVATDRYMSYLPLAHIFERAATASMICGGAAICFWGGDREKLVGYLAVVKPTIFCAVPRVLEKIKEGYTNKRAAMGTSFIGKTLDKSFSKKTDALKSAKTFQQANSTSVGFIGGLLTKKVKGTLGGSVRLIISGAAPLSPENQEFIKVAFGAPVVQGYGLTETSAAGNISHVDDMNYSHVGPPVPSVEIKLADVPDMGYIADKERYDAAIEGGNDKVRFGGEVWIRGTPVSSGYYKDPEKTAEDFDKDGWFHTGDVGRFHENGTLSIVDRKKNIFKTAFGEYISPEKLEAVYKNHVFISEMMITGDGTQKEVVAVVVLNPESAEAKAMESADLEAKLVTDLAELATSHKLQGFERVSAVVVVKEFTPDLMLTPTFKLKRPQIREGFAKEIAEAYGRISAGTVGKSSKKKKGKTADDEDTGAAAEAKPAKGDGKKGGKADAKPAKADAKPAKADSKKDVKDDAKPAKAVKAAEKPAKAVKAAEKQPEKKEASKSSSSSSSSSSSHSSSSESSSSSD